MAYLGLSGWRRFWSTLTLTLTLSRAAGEGIALQLLSDRFKHPADVVSSVRGVYVRLFLMAHMFIRKTQQEDAFIGQPDLSSTAR